MVYKNFLLRCLFSVIILSIYFIISYINFNLVFYLILLIYFIIILEIFLYFEKYKFIPIIYITLSLICFFNIDFKELNILDFNLLIIIIITFDIFSYFFGKTIGKTKLINISPKKTIEGLVGGIILSSLFAIIFSYYFEILINIELFMYIVLVIFSSLSGDLIESYFKRKNDLKNSSNIIPGHGGFFDRFDSFLFSIIVYSIFISF
tara:strand:- start:703 stop:1320 length:618 start_codon:yes stop_codon:yes gene_type:complete